MKTLSACVIALLTFTPLAVFATSPSQCAKLVSVKLPAPKGASTLTIGSTSLVAATPNVPEYCLVVGTIDRDINFNVGLPTSWNGKLMMEGNGGFAGSIPTWAIDYYVGYQYAVVGTDMGQTGDPADLLNRPDRVANLEYRSTHLVAVAAKEIVTAYFGAATPARVLRRLLTRRKSGHAGGVPLSG